MAFNTWRVEQELDDPSIVATWNDHATCTTGVLLAGPTNAVVDRLRAEAECRGVRFVVRATKYRRGVLDRAQEAIWQASDALHTLGFDLMGTSSTTLEHEGISVEGEPAGAGNDGSMSGTQQSTVLAAIAKLPGVHGVISPEDIELNTDSSYPTCSITTRSATSSSRHRPAA